LGRRWRAWLLLTCTFFLVLPQPLGVDGGVSGADTPEAIRWLMIHHLYAGKTIAFVAAATMTHPSTVYRNLRIFRRTGSVEGGERPGPPKKLTPSEVRRLKTMIDEDPTGFYDEYAVLLSRELNKSVSVPTVYRYMTRDLKYSRKKLHKIAQERRVDLRAAFLRGISEQGLRPAQLVFVDETSKDDRTARRTYAYGPVGIRALFVAR